MKKILLALWLALFAFDVSTNAQEDIDSLQARFAKLKKFQIANYSVKENWIKVKLSFNQNCSIVSYLDRYYDLENFELMFVKFMNERLITDTIVVQMDYEDITISKMVKTYEIIARFIEGQRTKGVYYIVNYVEPVRPIYTMTSTSRMPVNKNDRFGKRI